MHDDDENYQNNKKRMKMLKQYEKVKPKTFDFIECMQMDVF